MSKTKDVSAIPVESIKSAKEMAKLYKSVDVPVYIHGSPGLGKSDMWAQIAKEEGIGFVDIRLSMMDPVDLLGLPTVINGKTTWAKPAFWPDEEVHGKRGIILFDEMSDASKSLQSASYQIILNRKAGPHTLPPGWYPCAAGNLREDRAAAQALSTALMNRFAHINVVADYEAWKDWAIVADIDPIVIAFLRQHPRLLHSMEGGDLKAFPTPRSWAKASRCVKVSDGMTRLKLMSGLVGQGAAGEFDAFMRVIDMPGLEEIVKDPKRCRIPKEPSSKYALASMLSQQATKKNFGAIAAYAARKEFGRDFEILCVIDATKKTSELCETDAFTEFANRNSDLQL